MTMYHVWLWVWSVGAVLTAIGIYRPVRRNRWSPATFLVGSLGWPILWPAFLINLYLENRR